jgi:hypothetical protein
MRRVRRHWSVAEKDRLSTGQGMTADEIREVVERMRGIVTILESASPKDRRKIYEAAQLTVIYDLRTGEPSSEPPPIRGVEF